MAQQRESFLLNPSKQFSLATGAENRTDLTLSPNPDLRTSIITGTVLTDTTPLVNDLVKVLTPAGDPVDHQFTNSNGLYLTKPLPTGIYQLVAAAPRFSHQRTGNRELARSDRQLCQLYAYSRPTGR